MQTRVLNSRFSSFLLLSNYYFVILIVVIEPPLITCVQLNPSSHKLTKVILFFIIIVECCCYCFLLLTCVLEKDLSSMEEAQMQNTNIKLIYFIIPLFFGLFFFTINDCFVCVCVLFFFCFVFFMRGDIVLDWPFRSQTKGKTKIKTGWKNDHI